MLYYESISSWLNSNQGVVGVAVFLITLALGWISGIFASLRRKPKFNLRLLEGPNFCCNFETGRRYGEYPVHRTAFALYLRVTNVGSAASSIEGVSVGYRCNLSPFSLLWLRRTVGRFWIHEPTVSIRDFQVNIGDDIKFYPFLMQKSTISGRSAESFLVPGQSTNGVVYFEQSDSWGGFMPLVVQSHVRIRIIIKDAFGSRHSGKFQIRAVSLDEARLYNPSFGQTLAEIRGEPLPYDADLEVKVSSREADN